MRLRNKATGQVSDFNAEALKALESLPQLKAKFEPVDIPAPTPPEVEALRAASVDPAEDLIWVNDHKAAATDEQATANKRDKGLSKRSGI